MSTTYDFFTESVGIGIYGESYYSTVARSLIVTALSSRFTPNGPINYLYLIDAVARASVARASSPSKLQRLFSGHIHVTRLPNIAPRGSIADRFVEIARSESAAHGESFDAHDAVSLIVMATDQNGRLAIYTSAELKAAIEDEWLAGFSTADK